MLGIRYKIDLNPSNHFNGDNFNHFNGGFYLMFISDLLA